ncbi:uncharacterized protein LOC133201287 [Saccostrea echinata]|uniref:uncharacterized protein LOC133179504 n=1 Tax=Saccostrea echinata TaxID=191078 RepID=UPI002A830E00|nr:uncharacterized protein LOC133179504 [Saccostrea echinata]XP_061193069.1 uncharacterized protein LOC133201287 [Saccostrea echinata]
MMAFHIRCISQRIRASRSVVDFLQTPGFTHIDKRVQSATTVTCGNPRVSINNLDKILEECTKKKTSYNGNISGIFDNSFDFETILRCELVKESHEKINSRKCSTLKRTSLSNSNLNKHNVAQNLDKLGLVSHLTFESDFKCSSVPNAGDTFLFNGESSGGTPTDSEFEKKRARREENLLKMKAFLEQSLPPLFEIGISFDAYSPNIVLENNYWGKREITLGIQRYKAKVWTLQTMTGLRFIHTRMCLLNTSCDLDENFVRVRWRILGLKQLAAMKRLNVYGKFWKISKIPDRVLEKDAVWYDGISLYYLNDEGLVNKHVINRVEEESSKKVAPALSLRERLTRKVGVLPTKQI